jgi:hypothetical protein
MWAWWPRAMRGASSRGRGPGHCRLAPPAHSFRRVESGTVALCFRGRWSWRCSSKRVPGSAVSCSRRALLIPDVGLVYIESRHGPRRVRMMGPHRAGCNLEAKMMGMLVMSAYVGTAAGSPLNSQRSAGWSLRLRGGSADADLAPA